MSSIILLGPPGAGKGTQRTKLVEKYEFKEIIPGDLMREEVKNETPDGIVLAKYINNGLLAPHDLTMKIVKSKIESYSKNGFENIIFDGFPREMEQFIALNEILENYKIYKIKAVFLLKVDNETVKNRIKKRSLTSGRADDVEGDVIDKRIDIYYEKTNKVVEEYKKLGLLNEIDANDEIDEVFKKIDGILKKIL